MGIFECRFVEDKRITNVDRQLALHGLEKILFDGLFFQNEKKLWLF